MLSDQVSNVEFLGWDVNIGQSGKTTGVHPASADTFVADDLVSMYRKINYTNLTKKHGDKNAADNRVEQLKAIPGGNAEGGWDGIDCQRHIRDQPIRFARCAAFRRTL